MRMPWIDHTRVKRHGLLLEQPADDPAPCRKCGGACCRAFPSVSLSWEEYERLRALGASRLHFSLAGHHLLIIENGCEFLVAGRCTIYADRPDVCRRFICTTD
ncbi:YkgJ family cysteine cluster protein [Geobacter hydrogenophilus]|uniref:Zinc/iron-chelating domain-containing protein n=1 Tax=Geobacter hydrogenophilus TaxID=40983 RepID=A0A9W6G415_9BACT|nr:YkgJ family cysteine cluster protein [Geobacter hydrogenophilus]MBT0892717.1 YkgJ family cysteine cluster protein [Geobacter hydrogenophilus]GLI40116.1 zinc/iron-chelating domain-containing protein [Geobacter hydrogenophilus]